MTELDRRRFLQMAGSASLLAATSGPLAWAAPAPSARFAYVGTKDSIHVYATSAHNRLRMLQTMQAVQPVAMAMGNGVLYVANGVCTVENRPRGSVEAYAVDKQTGRLEWMQRAPLSLSGTHPQDLVVSPDGRSLVVAIYGGGAYNVLSIDHDGKLSGVAGIVKEIGAGPHPTQTSAHPSAVIFDRQGNLLTADLGADRVSVWTLTEDGLSRKARYEANAGSGPGAMVLHPDGTRLYVAHALDGSLSSFALATAGNLQCEQSLQASDKSKTAALAVHPSGKMLYASHGYELQTWIIKPDGNLQASRAIENLAARKLVISPNGETLLALTKDAVVMMKTDAYLPSSAVEAASLSDPLSITVG